MERWRSAPGETATHRPAIGGAAQLHDEAPNGVPARLLIDHDEPLHDEPLHELPDHDEPLHELPDHDEPFQ